MDGGYYRKVTKEKSHKWKKDKKKRFYSFPPSRFFFIIFKFFLDRLTRHQITMIYIFHIELVLSCQLCYSALVQLKSTWPWLTLAHQSPVGWRRLQTLPRCSVQPCHCYGNIVSATSTEHTDSNYTRHDRN